MKSFASISTVPSNDLNSMQKKKVIVLSGATSAGKSAVAMELCRKLGGEIVVADSVQAYKHLNIGSNKPTSEDQSDIPHHLIDLCEPSHTLSTGEFSRAAKTAISGIISRNKVPVVVGGSTMWLQWLVHGIPDAPKASDETTIEVASVVKQLKDRNAWEEGLNLLKRYDSKRAEKLAKNDWYRLGRFLEIAMELREKSMLKVSSSDGKMLTLEEELDSMSREGSDEESKLDQGHQITLTGERTALLNEYDVRTFFLLEEREQLYRTIDDRCIKMIRNGLLEEVTELLINETLKPEYPVAKSIGYRQAIDYLCKEDYKFDDMNEHVLFLSDFATATRNYAKRQINWHRKDPLFLFLEIDRSKSENTEKYKTALTKKRARENNEKSNLPYEKIINEIIHWTEKSEIEFKGQVKKQVENGEMYNDWSKVKVFNDNYQIKNKSEENALSFLLSLNEIRLLPPREEEHSVPNIDQLQPNLTSSTSSSTNPEIFTSKTIMELKNKVEAEGLPPMEWSSDVVDIRAKSRNADKGLKQYRSVIDTYVKPTGSKKRPVSKKKPGVEPPFVLGVETADICRKRLIELNPNIVIKFRDAFNSDSGKNDSIKKEP